MGLARGHFMLTFSLQHTILFFKELSDSRVLLPNYISSLWCQRFFKKSCSMTDWPSWYPQGQYPSLVTESIGTQTHSTVSIAVLWAPGIRAVHTEWRWPRSFVTGHKSIPLSLPICCSFFFPLQFLLFFLLHLSHILFISFSELFFLC